LVVSIFIRIFAVAYESKVSICKKSIAIMSLLIEFAKNQVGGRSKNAFACCVCYPLSISSGVRYVPISPYPQRCLAIPDKKTDMST
jgi:hypothetical protein